MQSQFVRYDAGNWGGFFMKIIPVWALLPHRPCNKINLQSRDQPLIIQVEIITNISSSQQNGDEGQVLIADASHILWLEHICWSYPSVGCLVWNISSQLCALQRIYCHLYIYLLDPLKLSEWVSVFSIEVVSSFSASSVSIFGILSPPGDLGIGPV